MQPAIELGQSAIHRVLFCQDIVEAIFSHLSLQSVIFRSHKDYQQEHNDKTEEQDNRRALASAARVSKFISLFALSVLWAQLRTFRHLVKLLPQYDPALRRLDGELTDADWGRFEKYAALVREAHFSPVMQPERDLWKVVLDRYQSVSRFLPRLKALETFHFTLAEDTLFTHSLLSHTLRHVSVNLDIPGYPEPPNGGALLTAALERVANAIPSLASLTISFVSFEPPQYRGIAWKIPSFKSIRKLDITHRLMVDASMLTTIGQFEHIRALSIHVSEDCDHLQGCLAALTELNIWGRASHVQSFLTATSPLHLQTLRISFLHDPTTKLMAQCMSAVPTLVPKTLSLLALQSQLDFTPKLTSAMDVIKPALALPALTDFSLALTPLPSISDGDIAAMLAAWPKLTTLRIKNDYGYRAQAQAYELLRLGDDSESPPARPTALILPQIAARCPQLCTLELPEVDLAATPALDALPPAPLGHPLRALGLQSQCADRDACVRAAVMLDRLFPSMRLPTITGGVYGEGEERGWDAVVRLLVAMRGRAHEFERARGWAGGEGDEDEDMGSD